MQNFQFRKSLDWTIIICTILLCGVGAAIIGSVTPNLVLAQIVFYAVGFGLFFVFANLDYRIFASLAPLAYLVALVLLGVTLLVGLETRGSVRWIEVSSFRLQFSELLKPFFATILGSFLLIPPKSLWSFFKVIILALVPTFLVFKQPDLGSALVYLSGFLAMIFIAGVDLRYLFFSTFAGLVTLPVAWKFLADYQRARLTSFLSPGFDPLGANYNAIQAVIAVGSGMFFGRGLGRGTQSHLLFLPEHHTDFVFASVAEELGFIGAAFVLALYFVLIWRIFSLSLNARDPMAKITGVGIGTFLLVQVFINVGMNLGIFPVTGITLPLISYGGSSVLATMIGLGIVENIACLSKQADSNIIGV
ncbi:rod shape-determining protein RodA [Candidatus Microgenomates bacterium]|nr:rod shape-determining protein RodA [Candidatus Microgenomates bacterium]